MSDEDHGGRRAWTNVYLSFSLTAEERAKLDDHLRKYDFTLGMRLRQTVVEVLGEAGVEPPAGAPHHHD